MAYSIHTMTSKREHHLVVYREALAALDAELAATGVSTKRTAARIKAILERDARIISQQTLAASPRKES